MNEVVKAGEKRRRLMARSEILMFDFSHRSRDDSLIELTKLPEGGNGGGGEDIFLL